MNNATEPEARVGGFVAGNSYPHGVRSSPQAGILQGRYVSNNIRLVLDILGYPYLFSFLTYTRLLTRLTTHLFLERWFTLVLVKMLYIQLTLSIMELTVVFLYHVVLSPDLKYTEVLDKAAPFPVFYFFWQLNY